MEAWVLLQFVFSGLTAGAIYALVALGFCVVEKSLCIVNFAQGDFLTLAGFLAGTLLKGPGAPLAPCGPSGRPRSGPLRLSPGKGGPSAGPHPGPPRPHFYHHRGLHLSARSRWPISLP
ncbi:hypothetical protein FVE67_03900 [Thermosulfurimonas marina]|uniref:Branched-chain amino acid ABC transporter permease n=1 Tax=Thermosulfurimonas marina TaxID=2047767 RepID=A0A6H1WS45_9BACT|nr:hypothetical protein [Thermosulfurimonas marina]QJA05990.1 hypothetical protein FVE67_03900 [Thermosulfurimonas marina]